MTQYGHHHTWNFSRGRSTWVSLAATSKDIMYALSVALLAMPGATVKGSSVGATSTMDGVNRWTSASVIGARVATTTTNATSWIAITLANMGGVDVCISFIGSADQKIRVAYSAGGTYAVANTQHPTVSNTDEVLFMDPATVNLHLSTLLGDRVFTIATTADGSSFYWIVGRLGNYYNGGMLQKVRSTVTSPATFSPPVAGWSWGTDNLLMLITTIFAAAPTTFVAKSRAFGGTAFAAANVFTFFFGAETYAGSITASTRLTSVADLQSGTWPMFPIGLWSDTFATRGKLGEFIDFYVGPSLPQSSGWTIPGASTHKWILFGQFLLPWDDTVPVTY